MGSVNVWIVLIIYATVKCQMVEFYGSGNPGSIMFPGSVDDDSNENTKHVPSQSYCTNCGAYPPIPSEMASEIDELETYDDFLKYFMSKPDFRRELVSTRFGDEQERSNAVKPSSGLCKPEEILVSFKDETVIDHSFYYLPRCTHVKRCRGCCTSNLKSCQPINRTMTNFQVFRIDIALKMPSEVIVPLEEHTNCKCQCSLKSDVCSEKQEYNGKMCSCECRNTEEKLKCVNNYLKRWDTDNCACVCRTSEECHTGLQFNEDFCRCEKPDQGNNINELRTKSINNYTFRPYHPIIVTAPKATSPRRRHKDED